MIENEYRYNTYFKNFVDEYCTEKGCTLEEAFNDAYVRQMFWEYTDV